MNKAKLVEELGEQHKLLNVNKLAGEPNHKESKNWVANVASILKQLDETDYQKFQELQDNLYLDNVREEYRISYAQKMDRFIRQKVAEYGRYNFDEDIVRNNDENGKESKRVGVLDRGKENTFINCLISGFGTGMRVEGRDHLSIGNKISNSSNAIDKKWYEKWWIKYLVLPIVVGVFVLLITFYFFGIK